MTFAEFRQLKTEGYNVLIDLTAVDRSLYGVCQGPMGWERNFDSGAPAPRKERFELVYRLASIDPSTGLESKSRVEVRIPLAEKSPAFSVMSLWPNADWLEREVWDMFGIPFQDRPGIQRLLLYKEFVGHPLRKDYPLNKRQPLIGPESGELEGSPSFNIVRQEIPFE